MYVNHTQVHDRVRIALAKNAGFSQKGTAHATLSLLASFCKTSMKQDESQVNSSMCDPFCKHPAFLAKAILTLNKSKETFLPDRKLKYTEQAVYSCGQHREGAGHHQCPGIVFITHMCLFIVTGTNVDRKIGGSAI